MTMNVQNEGDNAGWEDIVPRNNLNYVYRVVIEGTVWHPSGERPGIGEVDEVGDQRVLGI